MNIHHLQHVPFEGLGTIEPVLGKEERRGKGSSLLLTLLGGHKSQHISRNMRH